MCKANTLVGRAITLVPDEGTLKKDKAGTLWYLMRVL